MRARARSRLATAVVAAACVACVGRGARTSEAGASAAPTVAPVDAVADAALRDRLAVRFDAAQPEAVLAILAGRQRDVPPTADHWRRLFATAGQRRLGERETAMGRAFTEEAFREFVLSDELLARAGALQSTLARWRTVDPTAAARRALAYLPEDAVIEATIYPVIKPRDNSFVWDLERDPAIFLYLDPKRTPEQLENTLAHELHHIGFGTVCPAGEAMAEIEALPAPQAEAISSVRAFGEGFAMLAAAAGPDLHPHASSDPADRARWDRDVARVAEDARLVETFLQDVLAGRLDEKAKRERAMSFYGVQGPWYTVGWTMAVAIERARGRAALLEAFCDPRRLLATYAAVATAGAGAGLAGASAADIEAAAPAVTWSPELVRALAGEPAPPATTTP